jgi:hypothetical protein
VVVVGADGGESGGGAQAGMALALRPGFPVRIGPYATALAALLTCGHYLPLGRARMLVATAAGIRLSSGFLAGVRGRAADLLETPRSAPHANPVAHRAGPARRRDHRPRRRLVLRACGVHRVPDPDPRRGPPAPTTSTPVAC